MSARAKSPARAPKALARTEEPPAWRRRGSHERVLVVGAGFAGLSAALHLAGAGHEVTVLEQGDAPGGLAGVLRAGGYTFDTGPSVLTMPDVIEETLAAVGESLSDWLTLHRLDPAYRARFADGSTIDVHADTDAMAAEIAAVCGPREVDGYRRLVAWLGELYRIEMPNFIARNLDSPLALLGRPGLALLRLGGLRRLAPAVGSFVRDDRLRRLFTFQSLYAGVAPQRALAIYAVIAYLDCVAGVYFPAGGMHALPEALAGAAAKHGVRFRYGVRVQRLDERGDRATGVITAAGERVPADAVVLSGELARFAPPRRRIRYAPSCVVLHAGSPDAGSPDAGSPARSSGLAHHTITFGAAWRSTFAELARGELMRDPSFLLTTPTVTDPTLAPPGRHAHYALFPAPNLAVERGVDWAAYRERVLATVHAHGLTGALDVARFDTPPDWAARGLAAGTPFGAAHTALQTGPFRMPTRHPRLANVVLCGASAQPGIGVPTSLISGRLAASRLAADALRQ